MDYFDLHCDTIMECYASKQSLRENRFHVSLSKAHMLQNYTQCYAIFIPDSISGQSAFEYFDKAARFFLNEMERNAKIIQQYKNAGDLSAYRDSERYGAILTVENANCLAGRLDYLSILFDYGVKMITLTWNGDNALGTGAATQEKTGLTPFGRQVVRDMESKGMIVDISHASRQTFYDIAALAVKPFVASHSCASSLCSHKRNLTNEQFEIIRDQGGLVGINFYKSFLNENPDEATMMDILRHTEHFLSLGGEKTVCFGSDFDGAELPKDMLGVESLANLCELFLKHNYSETLLMDIFYGNAEQFFIRNNLL